MHKKTGKNYNTLKWVLGILLAIFLMLYVTSVYLTNKFKPLIKNELKELVLNATDSLYKIEFSDLNANLITRAATLTDVKIVPDTNVFKRLIAQKKAPNNIYYIELKKLAIKNFHPKRLFKFKRLNIELLLFDNPDVVMVNRQFDFNESRPSYLQKSPYDYISKYLTELRVNTIDFKNIRFKYIDNNGLSPEIDSVSNLHITLQNWLIDKGSDKDPDRLYALQNVQIGLNDYSYATPDSLYHIKLNKLNYSSSAGKLNIESFSVAPRYGEMNFGKAAGSAKERYAIKMSDISLEGINFPLYVRKRELYASEMNISNGSVAVFNNNTLPAKVKIKNGKYPHQLLQQLKEKVTVGLLNLNDIDISYSEYDRDSKQKGEITFNHTSGTLTNITNVPAVKAKRPYLFANLTTLMMNKGKLDVNFNFDLNAKDGAFSYSGELGNMDGRALNKVTVPLGMVEVKRGKTNSLKFDIKANDQTAKGKVDFSYNDLSVSLLKKVEGESKLKRQGWISLIANAMVINSDNPGVNGVLISAPVAYQRPATASFFSFIWRTLFQGIKYSVGVTPQKEQKINAQIQRFEQIKIDREKRREARSKRKAEKEGK
ncbi:MAG: hypothetical protein EOO92_05720 [Pedobacter sp.]|nr:MAG: hypothetical protein EOO92_05720 [Pedobacter sp.]